MLFRKKKVAILYVCTGKYCVFWKDFYPTTERYFLRDAEKHYFVFTEAENQIEGDPDRVHRIDQPSLGWPGNTLFRFRMFLRAQKELADFDYLFFLNANMRFLEPVRNEVLASKKNGGLFAVTHPGYWNSERQDFPYEQNPASRAFIPLSEGRRYVMGGFNGGSSEAFLAAIATMSDNIQADFDEGLVAVYHDESHWNKYLLDKTPLVLSPSYGYPEGWGIPFKKKIIVMNKNSFGGHAWLRGEGNA